MFLSDLTPWPIITGELEVSDDELLRIPQDNVRVAVEKLLRQKRVTAAYKKLLLIAGMIADKIAEAEGSTTLDNHIAKARRVALWRSLGTTVVIQMDWMLKKVEVTHEEVYWLVNRWLMLHYDQTPAPREQGVRI